MSCTVKLYKKPGALQFNLHLKFDLLKDLGSAGGM